MSATIVHDALIAMAKADPVIASIFGAEIHKGMNKDIPFTEIGRSMHFLYAVETDTKMIGITNMVTVMYGFLCVAGFYDPDGEKAEDLKISIATALKNMIEKNSTINGTCVGITEVAMIKFQETGDIVGEYIGTIPIHCFRKETRGAR